MSKKTRTFVEDTEGMTQAEERIQQALISSRDEEKRRRLATEKELQGEKLRTSKLTEQLDDLQKRLSAKMDETNAAVMQLTQFMLGKGPVTMSDTLREAITEGVREEFEKREKAMKASYERLYVDMQMKLTARDNEIRRLKNIGGDDNDATMPPSPDDTKPLPTMTQGEIDALKHRKDELAGALFGQSTESDKYHHGIQQTEDADSMDIDGDDVPEERIVEIARTINSQRKVMKGIAKPRRYQPLQEFSGNDNNKVVLRPEGIPADAKPLGCDKRYRTDYVQGYVRMTCIEIWSYLGTDGSIYTAKLPEKYNNCMGHTPATETIVAQILVMHYDQGITVGDIMKWLKEQGLNYGKSTIQNWIAIGADMLEPLDKVTQDEITSKDNIHADETTCKMCDKRLPGKDESEDDVEDIVKYFKRWLFCVYSPELKLAQFFFHKRGRRSRYAILEYLKDVRHKLFLHSDGAPLYKCYDRNNKDRKASGVYELIVRLACLVHIRRPLYKLKDISDDAGRLVDLINRIFHEDEIIKNKFSVPDDIKRERLLVLAPLLNELKDELENLLPKLEQEEDAPEMLKAVRYALKEFPCLLECLQDGRLSLDNNVCERTIRTIAKYRNNSLFVGSPEGGIRLARMKSVFTNCRAYGLNAYEYLCDVFRRIGNTTKEELVNLLPHKWKLHAIPQ